MFAENGRELLARVCRHVSASWLNTSVQRLAACFTSQLKVTIAIAIARVINLDYRNGEGDQHLETSLTSVQASGLALCSRCKAEDSLPSLLLGAKLTGEASVCNN